MVLHGEERQLLVREALDGPVVEVDVRELGAAAERVDVDGEAVVLRGDLDLAGGQIHDRLVAAVVAELELVGAAAEREPEDLVPEADAEDRHLAEQRARRSRRVRHGGGIAGAVGQEDAVGLHAPAPRAAGVAAGTTRTRQPLATRLRRMLRLMPKS